MSGIHYVVVDDQAVFDEVRAGRRTFWLINAPPEQFDLNDVILFVFGAQSTSARVSASGQVKRSSDGGHVTTVIGFERVWTHASGDLSELKLWRVEQACAQLRLASHNPLDIDLQRSAQSLFDSSVLEFRGRFDATQCWACDKPTPPGAVLCRACARSR